MPHPIVCKTLFHLFQTGNEIIKIQQLPIIFGSSSFDSLSGFYAHRLRATVPKFIRRLSERRVHLFSRELFTVLHNARYLEN